MHCITGPGVHEVLISYSTKDKKWADAACSVLSATGFAAGSLPRYRAGDGLGRGDYRRNRRLQDHGADLFRSANDRRRCGARSNGRSAKV